MNTTRSQAKTRKHLWLAAALAAVCAGLGAGAYAMFGTNGSLIQTVEAGNVTLDWEATTASPLSVPVGPFTPGSTVQRLVDLRNTGTVSVAAVQLAYSGSPSNTITSTSDGIQFRLERCSTPWTGATGNYTCPGQLTEITPDRPVTGRTNITGAASAGIGGTDHLRFTFRLPDSSPDNAKNAIATLNFLILGNQRPGQHQ